MSEDKDNFHKKFDEIINSDDLKKIGEDFAAEIRMGTKELVLIQQSLADAISHISEVLIERSNESYEFVFTGDTIYHDLLASLYKISEDFNEVMIEYYMELIDDDDDDDLIIDNDEGETDGPF